jgi:2Fe-2S ferredoxin
VARFRVTFRPRNVTVEVDDRDFPYGDRGRPGSLLDIALRHGIPLEHTCGGQGACTTCHVVVRQGMDSLSLKEPEEDDRLDMARGLTGRSRLGCQAVVRGDVEVEVLE